MKKASILFAEKGFEGTTLQSVANAVGITKAAVYHYFDTKQSIYDAIVIDLLERLDTYVRAHTELDTTHELRLKSLMISHADFFHSNYSPFVTLLHGTAGLSRPITDKEAIVRDRYEHFVREIISAGTTDGAFVAGRIDTTARAVLSMLNWMSRWYKPQGGQKARDFAEEYFALVWLGLKPR